LVNAARICAVVLAASLSAGCDRSEQKPPAAPRAASESFILAIAPYGGGAPVFVALAKGYFEAEGLKVAVQSHPSGRAALDEVLAGSADIATVAELPVALAALKGHPVTVLATVSTQHDYGLVTDMAIATPLALKGKRIAVTPGTSGDFLLDLVLVRHGLSRADVRVIARQPLEMADALQKGDADAVLTWDPHVSVARRRLGAKARLHSTEGIYESSFNLAASREFVAGRGEAIKKTLRALVRAEQFFASNRAESERIVAQYMKITAVEAHELLAKHRVALSLDQSLLVVMEDEARWALRNRIVEAGAVPNFLNVLHTQGLAAVKPRSVTVIR
jgi:NitT/TauT family transport system substrate-binding protein